MRPSDDGADVHALGSVAAATTTVVVGICELRDGELLNTAVTLASDGVLSVYRKSHLWDEELRFSRRGKRPLRD